MKFHFFQYPDSGIFSIFDEWQGMEEGGKEDGKQRRREYPLNLQKAVTA
jgi:hypothetical protein